MNREIKFRAWDKEEKKFCSLFGIDIDGDYLGWNSFVSAYDSIPEEMKKRFIVMQYTGLKDKNGKEIYEGDILQNQAQAIREVKRTKYGEYKLFIGKHSDQFWKGWIPNTVWEIIGNVYENPELIK